jgi:hypothetical protein
LAGNGSHLLQGGGLKHLLVEEEAGSLDAVTGSGGLDAATGSGSPWCLGSSDSPYGLDQTCRRWPDTRMTNTSTII